MIFLWLMIKIDQVMILISVYTIFNLHKLGYNICVGLKNGLGKPPKLCWMLLDASSSIAYVPSIFY